MGEMIDAIAHQWKQPLYQINAVLPALERAYAERTLTGEELCERFDEIERLTTHIARTVDHFCSYFHPHNLSTSFNLTEAVESTFSLLQGEFDRRDIACSVTAEKAFTVSGTKDEFI